MTDAGPSPLVLVIEDEPQIRRFLRASLTAHGYRFDGRRERSIGARATELGMSKAVSA